MGTNFPKSEPSNQPREFLAVPDCRESNRTSISEAGTDSRPLAYLTNIDNSKARVSVPAQDPFSTSSSPEPKLTIEEVESERDTWILREAAGEEHPKEWIAKRKRRNYEIFEDDKLAYELKFTKDKNVTYTLTKKASSVESWTITTESSHAWSYRISSKNDQDFNLESYGIPLFCLWLVTAKVASGRLNDLVRRRSPRALYDCFFREKNHMEVATVS